MLECLILGDSIARGTGQAVNALYDPGCDVQAEQSASTERVLTWQKPDKYYGTIIVAVGSNDAASRRLSDRLARLRQSLATRKVVWLLPYARPQAYAVRSIAARYGDRVIDLATFRSRDRVHPTRYSDIANALFE
ncbi:hypothetical protein FHS96_005024 [Sphingomonas zeicaulis]|uniref:hypothetical protein n=1 Tax=Sphingomonas zeicaulis TaxID=1632740 RepID=UPI003D1C6255